MVDLEYFEFQIIFSDIFATARISAQQGQHRIIWTKVQIFYSTTFVPLSLLLQQLTIHIKQTFDRSFSNQMRYLLKQWFSTCFDTWNSSLVMEQFGGTF